MSPAISTGYWKSAAETNSCCSAFSLNCVIRRNSPKLVTAANSQAASACAVTWLWTKTAERSGSSPVANSSAAMSSVPSRSAAGSCGTVIACRSTMQKKASPCSCVAAYWRKPPLKLPMWGSPVGWMPLKMRMVELHSLAQDGTRRVERAGCRGALGRAQAPAALAAPGPPDARWQCGSHRSQGTQRVRGVKPAAPVEETSHIWRWLATAPRDTSGDSPWTCPRRLCLGEPWPQAWRRSWLEGAVGRRRGRYYTDRDGSHRLHLVAFLLARVRRRAAAGVAQRRAGRGRAVPACRDAAARLRGRGAGAPGLAG